MFIVFEGIDGSGKTTISNRVAKLLRRRGRAVAHVREGGEFAQPLVSRLREFGKDRRNFELEPVAELLLYAAREAQLIADAVRPALASHDLVFADRYLYSCEVLACDGRGLARDIVRPIVDATACGLWPDLVVLCDADPHIARARRKARKIAKTAAGPRDDRGGGSRKSLGGVGMAHRMRSGYLALAAREPARWLVVDNTWSRLDDVVDRVVGVIDAIASGAPVADAIARARAAPFASPPAADEPTAGAAARAFFAFVEDRAEREPGVAAYLLSGLDDDRAWALRRQLAADEPALVAYSIRGMNSEAAWQLRAALVDDAPYQVARSLAGNAVDPRRAADLRERLAAHQPLGVVASLRGDATEAAWRLRRRLADAHLLAVVASLAGDDRREAWELRDRALALPGGAGDPAVATALAQSVARVPGDRAWAIRRAVFDANPIAAIRSLVGVDDDAAWQWRERYVARALKAVFAGLGGSEDPRAWTLRRAYAARVKEAVDSMIGLDSDAAWSLRDEVADLWPSTVVKSIVPLARDARAQRLTRRLLAAYPANVSLLKHVVRFEAVRAGAAALDVVV